MSFKISYLALISVSALSLSLISGCSNTDKSTNKPSYDGYYGTPHVDKNPYRPKILSSKPTFKRSAPKRYTVKKGDTLWAISNMFLNNPGYWPEIWDKNQKVANPHRIYPGDVLYIFEGGRVTSNGSGIDKMVPQLRVERNGEGDPISTVAPFLVWPRVLDKHTIDTAPYIVDARDANILIEKNTMVYVKNLKDRHAGGRYAIFHKGDMIKDPDSGKEFGYEVTYNGFLDVERPAVNADVAVALVADSQREIRRGDRILSLDDETNHLDAPIILPKHKVRGTVISLFDAEMISAQTQVMVINKGARNGIKAGYTLGVYSPGKTVNDPYKMVTKKSKIWETPKKSTADIPPARVATAIVYKVLNDISYALITDSSHVVKNGYKIGNP